MIAGLADPRLRRAATRSFEHLAKRLFCLEKRVLRSGFADFQNGSNFRMAEAFDFVEQENIPLMGGKAFECAFEGHAKRGMRTGRA